MASKIVDNSDMDDVLTTIENLIKAGGDVTIKQHGVCEDCGKTLHLRGCFCDGATVHVVKVSTTITFPMRG